MELNEEQRYRLGYLALRLAIDLRLDRGQGDPVPLLKLQDLLLGTHLAEEYVRAGGEKRFASQKVKLQDFIEAEFGEEIFQTIAEAIKAL